MKKFILLATLLICTNFHVYAKTSTEEHITGFIKEFSSNNIKGTASRFFTESPHFIFGPHILTPKDSEQVEKVLSEIHDALAKKGYMNSEIVSFETHFQSRSMSVTTILLKRYTSEGLLLDHQFSTYTLADTSKGWKILSWLPSEPKDNTRCFASES
ncbi:hypothetical protein [Microbulbifer sp. THAF38]|uniref:DUF6841 family protein n=1 Tax=Microbulbifer sp. THAF38 TaxID=2587856 RepID=UPI001268DC09|nr:hypothetical protein [Microbulbifer sp. THAF38]QFT55729.1 hypothetical protein FIU95_14360 [Microbulbifer sp. THAF38]